MKQPFAILAIAVVILLCFADSGINEYAITYPAAQREVPTVNLPKPLWQKNWYRTGSCVFAATIDGLRWQGRFADANRIRSRYYGGASYDRICSVLSAEGIRYASTVGYDPAFLDQACASRRGAIVTINVSENGGYHYTTADMGYHCVFLCHLDSQWAGIIDNNISSRIIWLKRDQFLAYWDAAPTWAVVPVYSPTSPRIP